MQKIQISGEHIFITDKHKSKSWEGPISSSWECFLNIHRIMSKGAAEVFHRKPFSLPHPTPQRSPHFK